ncbi:MAG TPA: mechanosensitive ion channel domain-containing protein [Acidobacteriota bacterium]|nr:mechanosensitive ion channel domain-containing protein [Acidobacteriota bacterium]
MQSVISFPGLDSYPQQIQDLLGFDLRFVIYPIAAILLAVIVRFVILRRLKKLASKTESEFDDMIVDYLNSLVLPFLIILILYSVAPLMPVGDVVLGYIHDGLAIGSVVLAAFFTAKFIASLFTLLGRRHENWQRFLQPLRTLVTVVFSLIVIGLSLKILDVRLAQDGGSLLRIVGIIIGAYILLKIISLAVIQMEQMVIRPDASVVSESGKRAKTLGKIVNSAAFLLIIGVSVMMILSEIGINIVPIITGAGIAGLAIGFGAQNLVRDFISGFFLILEDQIRVGDVVRINGTGGSVEAIYLRTTVLRDLHGTVHIFPNGEIREVSNMTKEYSRIVLDIGVAYKENVDHVMETLKSVGEELANDPEYGPFILEPLEILGVEDFIDSQVKIRIRFTTAPLKQWSIGRELRRRIKNTFDRVGIELPFPHVSVYFGTASKPFDLAMRTEVRADHPGGETGKTD